MYLSKNVSFCFCPSNEAWKSKGWLNWANWRLGTWNPQKGANKWKWKTVSEPRTSDYWTRVPIGKRQSFFSIFWRWTIFFTVATFVHDVKTFQGIWRLWGLFWVVQNNCSPFWFLSPQLRSFWNTEVFNSFGGKCSSFLFHTFSRTSYWFQHSGGCLLP